MAIPFNLPSDHETEDVYRRLDQLLIDLYDLLRIILFRPTPAPGGESAERSEDVDSMDLVLDTRRTRLGEEQVQEVQSLPDVVSEALPLAAPGKAQVPPPRRRRRRPHPRQHSPQILKAPHATAWLNVGIELRQIAQDFTTNFQSGEVTEKKKVQLKASSLFSLLLPAPISGSVWTTVLLLVGWKLLTRHW